VIHSPGFCSAAKAAMRAVNSSGVPAVRRSRLASWNPPSRKWVCPAGHDQAVAGRKHFRRHPDVAGDIGAVSHAKNGVSAPRNAPGPRLVRVAGPHPPEGDHPGLRGRPAGAGTERRGKEQGKQERKETR